MIDHDRLFKELLTTFFIEFIELFFPTMASYVQPSGRTSSQALSTPISG